MVNNKFLLDTHIFIWWMEKSNKLSKDKYDLINNPQNSIFLSIASIWEIIIKKGKKKLKVPQNLEANIKTSRFSLLPIEITHILQIEKLPLVHNDPFDRMLIAQSIVENLTLITSDQKIWKYKLKFLKA